MDLLKSRSFAVAIGPLLFAYWAARQERWGWFTVAAVLALSCKEDVALTMVVLGLLVGFRLQEKTGRVVLGMAVAAAGVLVPIQAGAGPLLLLALCVAGGGIAIAWLYGATDRRWTVIGLGVALLATLVPMSLAQQQASTTKINVNELCCNGCVKRIAKKLNEVSGVAGVKGDLPTATVFVTHQPGTSPLPRAMWEAVEKAGYKPTRLEGPSGTFTEKPRQ